MNKHVVTGVVCGGIGLLMGYKITANMVVKLLKSDELKQQLTKEFNDMMAEHQERKNITQDIIFDTRDDAQETCESLLKLIDDYGHVSVADYCDLVGVTSDFKDNKKGWTNLDKMSIYRTSMGYSILMPKTITLN